jgi:hypothetical protein
VVVEAGLLVCWRGSQSSLLGIILAHPQTTERFLDQDYEVLIWGTACAAFGLYYTAQLTLICPFLHADTFVYLYRIDIRS